MSNRTVDLKSVTFSNGKFSILGQEAKEIAISEIRHFFGLPAGCYLREDGNIVITEWDHNYHEEKTIRKASLTDEKVIEVLKEMIKAGYVFEAK